MRDMFDDLRQLTLDKVDQLLGGPADQQGWENRGCEGGKPMRSVGELVMIEGG